MKHTKESFYLKYEKLVYQFLWDYLKTEPDRVLAKDVLRELYSQVWVRVFRSFHKYQIKTDVHIKRSLRVTSQNVYFDYLKQQKREMERTVPAEEILQEMVSNETIDTALFTVDRRKYLKEAIGILNQEEQYLIWEYYFTGREGKDTALYLDMNHNTLRTKVNRVCKKLRKEMERLMKEGGDLDE